MHHTFYDCLRIPPEEHPILLTEMPLCPKANRERMTQIMFETFNTPAVFPCSSSLLSLYGSGRTTGLVVETGHTFSVTVPICKGYSLPHAILKQELSGSQLSDFLTNSLSDRQLYSSSCQRDRKMIRYVKETLSFVSHNYQHQISTPSAGKSIYRLPDGNQVSFGNELFLIPETLFQPSLSAAYDNICQPNGVGIHESVHLSINKCDSDIRKHLYNNVVLSGGNSLFPGFRERLEREISLLSPQTNQVKVIAPQERKLLAWIGGANLASLSVFTQMCTSKQEYDESGPCTSRRRIFY